MDGWMFRVAAEFQSRVPQLLFLINNLDLISAIVSVCVLLNLDCIKFFTCLLLLISHMGYTIVRTKSGIYCTVYINGYA